jgi:hypothetical protein
VADEIADIRNVLAGETSKQQTTRIDEREVVDVAATDTTTTSETSSEAGEDSSFGEQTSREMHLALHADGQVDVSGQYGPTKIDAAAGFAADFSLDDATARATQVAKHAVARAASTVENRTRVERTQRVLTRLEDIRKHAISNDTGDHVRGVYRWVSRVDRLQVWRYPDRLQLEFQIPEPARLLRAQLSAAPPDEGALAKPPEFAVPDEGITPGNYLGLAATYGATGLPEPPDPATGVAESFTIKGTEPLPTGPGELWNAPALTERKEIAIPPGYAATSVTVKLDATPIHGQWRRELDKEVNWETLERYHTITASIAVGDDLTFATHGKTELNSIQGTGTSTSQPHFVEAHLHGAGADATFGTPLISKVPVAVTVTGAATATAAVLLHCEATGQALAAWRQDVFDGLRSSYDLWLREWRAEQSRGDRPSGAFTERSPARHQEMIRAEIKRHIVGWLLGESPFEGRSAVVEPPAAPAPPLDSTPDIDVSAALEAAPDIQFLEQCLEWTNLSWVTYPYFWADRKRWAELIGLETVDPELGRFLRAGSIRVVVPARPGFAGAVGHWLLYRQPWYGGPAPLPGSPLYLSIAQEIRDQAMPPPDGQPGESWEVVLPTTLLWLDDDPALPENSLARLGQPPNEPADARCPDRGGEPHA